MTHKADHKPRKFSDFDFSDPFPDELLNLYNPGYVATVVYLAGRAYQQKNKSVPHFCPFLFLPLICTDGPRSRLPKRVVKLRDWIRQHSDVLYDIPETTITLRPFVSSGLFFLRARGLVKSDRATGHLKFKAAAGLSAAISNATLSSESVADEVDKAPLVGRLLAAVNDESSILAAFGLKP